MFYKVFSKVVSSSTFNNNNNNFILLAGQGLLAPLALFGFYNHVFFVFLYMVLHITANLSILKLKIFYIYNYLYNKVEIKIYFPDSYIWYYNLQQI